MTETERLTAILVLLFILVMTPITSLIVVGCQQEEQKIERCTSTGGVWVEHQCVEPHRG